MTGAFNGLNERTLMFRAISGQTAGQNFATVRKEAAKHGFILVIYEMDFAFTKPAVFFARNVVAFVLFFFESH
jgi:hypothetical protein